MNRKFVHSLFYSSVILFFFLSKKSFFNKINETKSNVYMTLNTMVTLVSQYKLA